MTIKKTIFMFLILAGSLFVSPVLAEELPRVDVIQAKGGWIVTSSKDKEEILNKAGPYVVDISNKRIKAVTKEIEKKIEEAYIASKTSGVQEVIIIGMAVNNTMSSLKLEIPQGVMVYWQADYTGNSPEGFVEINGKYGNTESFEMTSGKIENTQGSAIVLRSSFNRYVFIYGGEVIASSATGQPAIEVEGESGVNVENAIVRCTNGPAIKNSSPERITVNIFDGSKIISTGAASTAAIDCGNFATIHVNGGTIEGKYGIRAADSFGTNSIAIRIYDGKVSGTTAAIEIKSGSATYFENTCFGNINVTGSGVIVSVAVKRVPKLWQDTSYGLELVAGTVGSVTWDTTEYDKPKISLKDSNLELLSAYWGTFITDEYMENVVVLSQSDEAAGYDVYRSANRFFGYKLIGTTDTNFFYDNNLVAGKTYYYKSKPYIIDSQENKVLGKFSSVIVITKE